MTHEEWQAAQDGLWEAFLRRQLDSEEYAYYSLGLGPDPAANEENETENT